MSIHEITNGEQINITCLCNQDNAAEIYPEGNKWSGETSMPNNQLIELHNFKTKEELIEALQTKLRAGYCLSNCFGNSRKLTNCQLELLNQPQINSNS